MGKHAGQDAANPTPARRPPDSRGSPDRPAASRAPQQALKDQRVSMRDALDAALGGAMLRSREKQFLNRLVKWNKRNAASVVSLLWRARLAGRAEAGLTESELEIVLGALNDAATYRDSGADSLGCLDCENMLTGRCDEHARDQDRARSCTELASVLTARKVRRELPAPASMITRRSARWRYEPAGRRGQCRGAAGQELSVTHGLYPG